MGLQSKKSPVVRLQLLPCSSFAGPAASKIWSVQIAVSLQLSCWNGRSGQDLFKQKTLKLMPFTTKELTSVVCDNKATKLEETSAVTKNTDTTKDDGLPCDHFQRFTLQRVKPPKWKSKERNIQILLQRRKRNVATTWPIVQARNHYSVEIASTHSSKFLLQRKNFRNKERPYFHTETQTHYVITRQREITEVNYLCS